MTAVAPLPDETLAGRVKWTLHDYRTIVGQEFTHLLREPANFAWTLGFPIVMVLLFVYVFGSAMDVTGQGAGVDYVAYAMPGMFAMTMAFGFMNTAMAVAYAKEKGMVDRIRSMPTASSAVVVGRNISDTIHAGVDLLVLFLIALAIGWRSEGTVWETLGAFALLIWLRFALIWIGVWIGLMAKNVEQTGSLFALAFPFGMVSSVFTPPELMPGWLGAIAAWNPVSATATAIRELFGNPVATGGSWPEQHALAAAVLWPLLITLVFLPLGVRRFRNLGR
ncbi:ABC-type polysaccharide/polyol phosphate export permease [Glycomyces sambucus]|uniref:Transport permease protein n=1 Tax=Glycomyces sambucus TaxID=380244 RepID=A0A1G9HAD8_9ACTN|nr:ABC transporter permease [Glycomyces sambucus]SDL09890.1 ABC-type polysaccharide/polyol phosphate export permease [Glycomyces sambucus]